MGDLITELQSKGFLESTIKNGVEIFHVTTPCCFRIEPSIVSFLMKNYSFSEEIGGVLWAKPINDNEEYIYHIDKVSLIRNAIEDKPRNNNKNKSNAYFADKKQIEFVVNDVITHGYLPLRFHTHPVKGENFLDSLSKSLISTETSKQDKSASFRPYDIENKKILMPRGLIVGNDISKDDIFIGIYNGFIAPNNFEKSKINIQNENIKKTTNIISKINLNDSQKIGLLLGVLLLLFVIVKYRKYSIPVLSTLSGTLILLSTNTRSIEKPSYFNKLSSGSVDIYIPESKYY